MVTVKLTTIIKTLKLEVQAGAGDLSREVTGAYVSDLLSDVLAHAQPGYLWATLQTHPNIVAVAVMKELSGIVVIGGKEPSPDTLAKAKDEGIPVITSPLTAFELSGRLYALGLHKEE